MRAGEFVGILVIGAVAGIIIWTAPLWAAWITVLILIIVAIALNWTGNAK